MRISGVFLEIHWYAWYKVDFLNIQMPIIYKYVGMIHNLIKFPLFKRKGNPEQTVI